ncbi:MAG: hypothetical protein A3H72_03500 [Candidatus Doudnabacteria bacterium RIFCSPLOWO2_02_FULL_48_8]|uniref:SCP domain-containing protein n=1 Tax=Candidatus Doudnabacteria bacterium RIFCSPHIGHO2_01_FULL_46_24 TaxID=1817825 RepID=A0A1F5NU86_9BACT|nr:MAG: hypothetical protein A2720_01570 [Candidatus Doudnabacteria bacterium RIFCSPHIGHO2_01_FULL_46_24]OGE94941.1 MAG: hypothetical protein A3H72_03500 [Candidatus Doudnabacteria bacterium RIFCSPLOWO2_02_FULL_48_8]OGE95679.1 MAG: hypothetical protein A3E98_02030 [Candidatus Doudnabacteria bacterium RIFCSPHIGHO2_12_FULL_48_11]
MRLKYYLLANEENDYQPWILRSSALAIFCLTLWGLRILIPLSFTYASPGIDPVDLMNRINAERTNRFVPALITNQKLISAAASKAGDMIDRGYFAHVDPDGNYVWPRIEAAGYNPYLTLGENLAMDFNSAAPLMEAWMNSPTHRANIVNEKFQDQGLAVAEGLFEPGHNTITVASLFGTLLKPATPTPQPTPAPSSGPAPSPVPTPVPAPAPTTPGPQPQPALLPAKTPPPPPAPQLPLPPQPTISINPDIKLNQKFIGDNQILELDVIISGNPKTATAAIKDKKIQLLPSAIIGQYLGVLTFPAAANLSEEKLTIAADGISSQFDLNHLKEKKPTAENSVVGGPAGQETAFPIILKIVFTVFAAVYLTFLVVDSIIIHRSRIKRVNPHSSSHSLLLMLIIALNFISIWL